MFICTLSTEVVFELLEFRSVLSEKWSPVATVYDFPVRVIPSTFVR